MLFQFLLLTLWDFPCSLIRLTCSQYVSLFTQNIHFQVPIPILVPFSASLPCSKLIQTLLQWITTALSLFRTVVLVFVPVGEVFSPFKSSSLKLCRCFRSFYLSFFIFESITVTLRSGIRLLETASLNYCVIKSAGKSLHCAETATTVFVIIMPPSAHQLVTVWDEYKMSKGHHAILTDKPSLNHRT